MKIRLATVPATAEADVRPPGAVLGHKNPHGAPSARGSTYWSRLMTCPREHALHTIAKLRPERTSSALTSGFVFHHAMEVYYRHLMECQRPWRKQALADLAVEGSYPIPADEDRAHKLAAAQAARSAMTPFDEEPGYETMMEQIHRMLDGYFDLALFDQHMVIAVEEDLEYKRRGLVYTARIDGLILDYGDRKGLWVLEHKTAKALNESLLEGYQLNLQILGQAWLFKNVFDTTKTPVYRGVLVQIITKTQTPKYTRIHVAPSPAHLATFEKSLRAWAKIEKAYDRAGWPHDFTKCAGYSRGYSRCAFYNLCQVQPDATIEALRADPPPGYQLAIEPQLTVEEQ